MAEQTLKRTIDSILDQAEADILKKLESSMTDVESTFDGAVDTLEQEYDKIVLDANKEAEKIEKQLVGGADLEARNKLLLLVEESVDRVFQKAVEKIRNADRNEDYRGFIGKLLDESASILGSTDFTVYTSGADQAAVQSLLPRFPGSSLAPSQLDCMGGIKAVSKDGSMTFDNTIDARLDRMKPLIRKEIALKFGLGN